MNTEKLNKGYDYNETFNTCIIYPNSNFPNGSFFNYTLCPEEYNSSRKFLVQCCFQIMKNELKTSGFEQWMIFHIIAIPVIILYFISFYVLCRNTREYKIKNRSSINFYMKCMCIFDALTIIFKFINQFFFVRNSMRKLEDAFKINPVVCKIIHFSESTCVISTAYILVLMNFYKLMGIARPMEMKIQICKLCRPKWEWLNISFVLAASIAYNSFYIFNIKYFIETNPNKTHTCNIDSQDAIQHKNMHQFDKIVKILIPVVILCIINILMIILLVKPEKGVSLIENIPLRNLKKQKKHKKQRNKASTSQSNPEDTKKRSSSILLVITVGIIILNLPYFMFTTLSINNNKLKNVLLLSQSYYLDEDNKSFMLSKNDIEDAIKFDFFHDISHFLYDFNYAANFLFYFLLGSSFRGRLCGLFKRNFLRRITCIFN